MQGWLNATVPFVKRWVTGSKFKFVFLRERRILNSDGLSPPFQAGNGGQTQATQLLEEKQPHANRQMFW